MPALSPTLELAFELIRRPSVTPADEGCQALMCERLAAAGFSIEPMRIEEVDNFWARRGGDGPVLCFAGHTDVVPTGPLEAWQHAPFAAFVDEEGMLHGRGAVDAKGPAVAFAAAFAAVARQVGDAITLRFIGAVAEEHPSSRGARHALLAYPRPHALIVGEPSGSEAFTLGYKGSARLHLTAMRPVAHGAREEPTAAETLLDALAALRAFAAAQGGERSFDRLQVAVLGLESSDDGLRSIARARVTWRLPLAWPPARLHAEVAALALPGVTLAWTAAETAVRGERDGALARAFRVAIRAEGGAATPKVKTGTSDWNVVAPVWAVDTVAYGPGDASLDHTPEERIERDDVLRAIRVLTRVLRTQAERPDHPRLRPQPVGSSS